MGQDSAIEWCSETWNFWIGCTKYAKECANCYAAAMDERRFSRTLGNGSKENPESHWGKGAPRYRTGDGTALAPLKWNKQPFACTNCGAVSERPNPGSHFHAKNPACWCSGQYARRRVFTGSMMDWADEEVQDEWRDEMFTIIEQCPRLEFLLLTKRGKNMLRYVEKRYGRNGLPPHNCHFGMSWMAGRSKELDFLRQTPCLRTRWISAEPLLEDISYELKTWLSESRGQFVDWIILGGESEDKGSNTARPCHVDWIHDALFQAGQFGLNRFVKQLGSNVRYSDYGPAALLNQGRIKFKSNGATEHTVTDFDHLTKSWRINLFHYKGQDISEWPDFLRIRESPFKDVPQLTIA